MRILLDTCEFLWLVSDDSRLSPHVASAVRDPLNEVFLSVVSFWEISLKHKLGKLPFWVFFNEPLPQIKFEIQISFRHGANQCQRYLRKTGTNSRFTAMSIARFTSMSGTVGAKPYSRLKTRSNYASRMV